MLPGRIVRCGFWLAILLVGCSSPQKAQEEDPAEPAISVEAKQLGDSDSGKALGMVSIPFEYRQFVLTEAQMKLAKANLNILRSHSSLMIEIEGHCDTRGGPKLNMELGDKRARAVKEFFVKHGADPAKLTSISYGASRPLDPAAGEEAMKKNRRVNFLIISR